MRGRMRLVISISVRWEGYLSASISSYRWACGLQGSATFLWAGGPSGKLSVVGDRHARSLCER